ncbi:CHRD domain-containing protein [Leptolyngbyaceae cyanobacterium UHCC 1019]
MAGIHGSNEEHNDLTQQAGGDIGADASKHSDSATLASKGSSIQTSDFESSLNNQADLGSSADHNHAGPAESPIPKMSEDFKQHNGTKGADKLVGDAGDDFIFPGTDSFSFNQAEAKSGAEEFPFPNDSKGSSEANLSLDDKGNFKVEGSFKDFDGAPLFSQGEKEIDPKAEILNGSDPKALVDGFLAVPEDKEGNQLSGTHLHFSPSGDDRGNFADATVVRFLENTINADGKSGNISANFELKPDEQAALLAGNLYANLHSNVDVDGDGKAGFPTGENRLNFNQKVVEFA